MRGRRSTAATSTAACAGHSRSHLTNGVPTRTRKHENAKTRNNLKVFFFVVSCFRGFVIVRVYETRSRVPHGGIGALNDDLEPSSQRGGAVDRRGRCDLRRGTADEYPAGEQQVLGAERPQQTGVDTTLQRS